MEVVSQTYDRSEDKILHEPKIHVLLHQERVCTWYTLSTKVRTQHVHHQSLLVLGFRRRSHNSLPHVLYMGVPLSHQRAHGTLNSTQSILFDQALYTNVCTSNFSLVPETFLIQIYSTIEARTFTQVSNFQVCIQQKLCINVYTSHFSMSGEQVFVCIYSNIQMRKCSQVLTFVYAHGTRYTLKCAHHTFPCLMDHFWYVYIPISRPKRLCKV